MRTPKATQPNTLARSGIGVVAFRGPKFPEAAQPCRGFQQVALSSSLSSEDLAARPAAIAAQMLIPVNVANSAMSGDPGIITAHR